MWADHFKALGTPTVNLNFDNEFADLISTHIQTISQNCTSDFNGALSGPLTYEEVASICSNLKPGVSGVLPDYEHIRYAGPSLWRLLFHLYLQCFIIDSGGKLSTRLYDKRDDFDFHIVNFPFLSSDIPSGPSYGVYISQLIRYARCCSHYDDFRYCHKCLVD